MNIKLKAPFSAAIAIGVGIVVLAGYFIPSINNIRFILLRTGLVLAAVALMLVGALGMVDGITLVLAEEARPIPTALVAVTVNAYAVPLLNPVMV